MRSRLLWKLLAINIPVIGAVVAVVWLTIDYLAADYFMALMKRYNVSPAETHAVFLDAVHRYLIHASIGAIVLATVLSLLFTRKALHPLERMTDAARRIAAGDYGARIETGSKDEVGELANAFNRMTDSLEKVENLRKSMVADIAHELRTPLTNIRGYLEGLSDGVVAPSKDTFDTLQTEVIRLVRLVEDL